MYHEIQDFTFFLDLSVCLQNRMKENKFYSVDQSYLEAHIKSHLNRK